MGHREQGWVNIMKPRGQTEKGIRSMLRKSNLGLRIGNITHAACSEFLDVARCVDKDAVEKKSLKKNKNK